MKTRTTYECEICGLTFGDAASAIACEAQGRPDPAKRFPVGMILAEHEPGALYRDITFAVASYSEPDPTFRRANRHTESPDLWACRDNVNGDGLGKNLCNGEIARNPGKWYAKVDHWHPTFLRMIAYLKAEGIPITVWDGERPVPLAEWYAARESGRA